MQSPDKPIKYEKATDNQQILPEKCNDKKLPITILTVGTRLIAHHFW